jgi:hypothetical protein
MSLLQRRWEKKDWMYRLLPWFCSMNLFQVQLGPFNAEDELLDKVVDPFTYWLRTTQETSMSSKHLRSKKHECTVC